VLSDLISVEFFISTSNSSKPARDTIAYSDSSRARSGEFEYTSARSGGNTKCEYRAAANDNDQNTAV
jgi:hypothetical protein